MPYGVFKNGHTNFRSVNNVPSHRLLWDALLYSFMYTKLLLSQILSVNCIKIFQLAEHLVGKLFIVCAWNSWCRVRKKKLYFEEKVMKLKTKVINCDRKIMNSCKF